MLIFADCQSDNNKRNILGKHNLNNIMFVLAVSEILNLNLEKTIESIKNMRGLEHRLEFVREIIPRIDSSLLENVDEGIQYKK